MRVAIDVVLTVVCVVWIMVCLGVATIIVMCELVKPEADEDGEPVYRYNAEDKSWRLLDGPRCADNASEIK